MMVHYVNLHYIPIYLRSTAHIIEYVESITIDTIVMYSL